MDAFAQFYRAYYGPTLVLAKALSRRDEAFCLDLVQDVMLVVAKKLPPLADERALRGWLTTTLLRAIADRDRADRRRRIRHQQIVPPEPGETREPWLGLAADERSQWLSARLQELSPADQALLLARFGDSETVAAAGALHGLGADQAHGRLRRLLQRLRRQAAEWWHGR